MKTRLLLHVAVLGMMLGMEPAPVSSAFAGDADSVRKVNLDDPRLVRLLEEARLSQGVRDVAKLAEQGVPQELLEAHVTNSDTPYNLRPEDIAYLRERQVPDTVVASMIERGADLRARLSTLPPSEPPVPIWKQPASPTVVYVEPFTPVRTTPQSTVTVIGSSDLKRGLGYRYYYSNSTYWNNRYPRMYGSAYRSYGWSSRGTARHRIETCGRYTVCR